MDLLGTHCVLVSLSSTGAQVTLLRSTAHTTTPPSIQLIETVCKVVILGSRIVFVRRWLLIESRHWRIYRQLSRYFA